MTEKLYSQSEVDAEIAAAYEAAADIIEVAAINRGYWNQEQARLIQGHLEYVLEKVRTLTPAHARKWLGEHDAALRSSILATIQHLIQQNANVVNDCEKTREYKAVLDAVGERLQAENAALREKIETFSHQLAPYLAKQLRAIREFMPDEFEWADMLDTLDDLQQRLAELEAAAARKGEKL